MSPPAPKRTAELPATADGDERSEVPRCETIEDGVRLGWCGHDQLELVAAAQRGEELSAVARDAALTREVPGDQRDARRHATAVVGRPRAARAHAASR